MINSNKVSIDELCILEETHQMSFMNLKEIIRKNSEKLKEAINKSKKNSCCISEICNTSALLMLKTAKERSHVKTRN